MRDGPHARTLSRRVRLGGDCTRGGRGESYPRPADHSRGAAVSGARPCTLLTPAPLGAHLLRRSPPPAACSVRAACDSARLSRLKDEEFLAKRKTELERKGVNRGAAKEFKQEYVGAAAVLWGGGGVRGPRAGPTAGPGPWFGRACARLFVAALTGNSAEGVRAPDRQKDRHPFRRLEQQRCAAPRSRVVTAGSSPPARRGRLTAVSPPQPPGCRWRPGLARRSRSRS